MARAYGSTATVHAFDIVLRRLAAAATELRRERRWRRLDQGHLVGMTGAELEHLAKDVALPLAELKAQLAKPFWRR